MEDNFILKHEHIIIRAEIENGPQEDDLSKMNIWFEDLIHNKLNMKILLGPYCTYSNMKGNEGFTGICAIETSSITFHTWDKCKPNILQLDIYSCKNINLENIISSIIPFKPNKIEYKMLDRDKKLKQIYSNTLKFKW